MPCDSIRSTTVELGKVDAALLHDAITALGLFANIGNLTGLATRFTFKNGLYENGKLTLYGPNVEQRTNAIKQSYAAQVVKSQARKFGWSLKKTGAFKYEVTKGSI